jgi:predicted nuclease of predicted toxin-antitoxin system
MQGLHRPGDRQPRAAGINLWLDAQLPPLLASCINAREWGMKAAAVRDSGMRDASDPKILRAARHVGVVVMTQHLLFLYQFDAQGPQPHGIWLRVGDFSITASQEVLVTTLPPAITLRSLHRRRRSLLRPAQFMVGGACLIATSSTLVCHARGAAGTADRPWSSAVTLWSAYLSSISRALSMQKS